MLHVQNWFVIANLQRNQSFQVWTKSVYILDITVYKNPHNPFIRQKGVIVNISCCKFVHDSGAGYLLVRLAQL